MKFFKILALCLLLTPFNVLASEKVYESKNLEQTFQEEASVKTEEGTAEFEYDLTNYQETDDQITIYLFRGKGCTYCKKFLTFLNSIVDDYGKYFKLESYEVWRNKNNSELFEKVAEFLDADAEGVPFIIIGDQVFPGYASQYDESIKQAIVDLYNSDDKYDVFEEMEKAERLAKITAIMPYVLSVGSVFTATIIMIVYMRSNNKKINEKLNDIEKKLKKLEKMQIEKTEKNK